MTATTSTSRTRFGPRAVHVLRRMALPAGWLLDAIGARWDAFVDSGQLGPSPYQHISRHTGGRF
jgi:hypothetical protein